MPSFTHLIITRFMCDNFIKKDTGIDIDNEEWRKMSFDMAKRHIIPTLENQSNKNFILVFLVSDTMSDSDILDLEWLSGYINIKVIKLSEFNNYIKSINTDYLITSRLDYDDHVYKDCVKDIHQLLKRKKPEVCIYGLNQGVSIVDGENESHLMYNYPWLLGEGFPAPMTTLILARSACKEYFDIYKLGFHTECVKCLLSTQNYYLNKIYDIHQIYAQHKGYNIDYIWIRHPHSATTISINVTHTTNIIVELSDKELKENFGYII